MFQRGGKRAPCKSRFEQAIADRQIDPEYRVWVLASRHQLKHPPRSTHPLANRYPPLMAEKAAGEVLHGADRPLQDFPHQVGGSFLSRK